MNSDDLPIYPTPQQATYSLPPAQLALRRPAKPKQYAANNTVPPASSHLLGAFASHANAAAPPLAQDYPYQHSRPYQPPSQVQQQPQYYQPPPSSSAAPPPPANGSQYLHQNVYQGSSYAQSPALQQHRPPPVANQQYYLNGAPPPPAVPAPRVSSSSLSHYGSALQPSSFHQGNHYQQQNPQHPQHQQQPHPQQQYAHPPVPTQSPPAVHSPTTPQMSGRIHAPSKKVPASRSRESLDDIPKHSSKHRLEAELRSTFDRVDANHSGKISARELSAALVNFDNTGFQHSTVRLMIKLFSSPATGASSGLNFDQFVSLWKYLTAYKKLFVVADVNKSGDISFGEFQRIIEQIGYKLNVDLVLHLFQKFANKEAHDDGSVAVGKLKFDAFIELLVYLRKLTDIFKQYDKLLTGVATIDYLDFLLEISNLT